MKKEKNTADTPKKHTKLLVVLISIAVVLAILVAGMILTIIKFIDKPTHKTGPQSSEAILTEEVPVEEPISAQELMSAVEVSVVEESVIVEVDSGMLPTMEQLYIANQDVVGWLWIEGTTLNCPVMFTPDEPEKYLRKDFDGYYSIGGEPFIDESCNLDPESDNLIIYGHNMSNGSQFGSLVKYEEQGYWEEHPYIKFYTLYEERTYEIISCFYDRVYYKTEDVFKFYQFIDAEDENTFNEAMYNFKEKSEYDTGVTAEYGDNLITLVTCSGEDYTGRFVVVAKEVTEKI